MANLNPMKQDGEAVSGGGGGDDSNNHVNKPSSTTTTTRAMHLSRHERSYSLAAVCLVFVVPGLADFLYGYDCGAISYAIVQIQSSTSDDDVSGVFWGHILVHWPALRGLIVSGAAIGAFVASLVIYSVDASRKRELQVGTLFYIAGALLQVTSCLPQQSASVAIALLFLGRLVYGLGIGTSMHAAPAYLGEMSPSSIRGVMLALKEAANTLGVLIGYQVGYSYSEIPRGWVWTFAISTLFAATSLLLSLFLPRSARWLLLHGKDNEALESLRFVFQDGNGAHTTFSEIKNHLRPPRLGLERPTTMSLWDSRNRHALVIGVGIIVLQQITGSPAMLAYASTVFEEAGRASNSSVRMAMFQLAVTMVAVGLVEKCGRKILLYIGCVSMAAALVVLAACFGRHDGVVLIAMFIYIGGFQIGFGPMAWLIVAEVFSNEMRGRAVALCVQVNFSTYGLVQFGVPVVSNVIGFNGTFAIFAALSAYRYAQN